MDQNIFELAKKLAALSPGESYAALRLIREHGYKPGERTSAVIDLARALISVWDGKASTLDQASAWREVWKYLSDAEMVREYGGRSRLGQVLDILGDYRRMSAGAAPLYLVQQVSINGELSDADLEDVKAAMRQNNSGSRISPTGRSASLPKTPELWPTPSADKVNEIEKLAIHFSGCRSNAKCIPHEGTREEFECLAQYCMDLALQVKDIYTGRIGPLDFRGLEERVTAWFAPQEQPYDPATAKPCHPSHELYKTGDADAPEQIKDRNGEVVLDQCRYCRRAESQLLDGEPCAKAPANENYPPDLHGEPMSSALKTLATVVEPARLDVVKRLLVLQDTCYGLANNAGWWTDLETGEDVRNWPKKHLDNWVSAKLMLIVTEVAEAMEGHRKALMDTHLKHRGMLEVELADAVIRIMDLAGGLNMDVAGAIVEKLAYNLSREDHQIEKRKAAGGKSV